MASANRALGTVVRWITSRHLDLVTKKTQAVILTTKRKIKPVEFIVIATKNAP